MPVISSEWIKLGIWTNSKKYTIQAFLIINKTLSETVNSWKEMIRVVELSHGKKAMDGEVLDRRSFISEGSEVAGEVVQRERSIVHELDNE